MWRSVGAIRLSRGSRDERELQREAAKVRVRDAAEAVDNRSVTTPPSIREVRVVYVKGGLVRLPWMLLRVLPHQDVLA